MTEPLRFEAHTRRAYPAILGAILIVIVVETGVLHLLLGMWSTTAAWISTSLGAYTAVWLMADYRAARRNPTVAGEDALSVRVGLRWRAVVPWAQVRGLRTDPAPKGTLALTLFGPGDFWLELHEPVTVRGPMGLKRRVEALALGADDPAAMQACIEARIARPAEAAD